MKLKSDIRNVVVRRREQVVNTSDFQNCDNNPQPNVNSKDQAALIEEIKNEYKTIPPEYLQAPRRRSQKVSFTRQMSLRDNGLIFHFFIQITF